MNPPTRKVRELMHRYPSTMVFLAYYTAIVVTVLALIEAFTRG